MDTDAIEQLVLSVLSKDGVIEDSWDFAAKVGVDHQAIVGAVKSLLVDAYVVDQPLSTSYWILTKEGTAVLENGSPEFVVFNVIAAMESCSIAVSDLNQKLGDVAKVGLGACMKNKWVKKVGDQVATNIDTITDETSKQLQIVQDGNENNQVSDADLKNLKRRQMVEQKTRKSIKVMRGPDYQETRVRKMPTITKEMLAPKMDSNGVPNGQHWSVCKYKNVNLNSMGAIPNGGNFHPLLKVRAEFRRILMEMGFEEMPTSKWVESSFWNFDSLFQPQSHPARDAHDTFFMKDPANCNSFPEEYYEIVKATHENGGGFGSIGYGCNFKREEALKNILRTHTTAVSAQMLYNLAHQEGGFKPKKYFSVDRVFRNEAMDATHLCEFHQVEGLVADYGLTLGHLIGTIRTFFEKIGITQVRFKPAYNPYTEPSMEIFGYHPELKKWTEIGNSGMFRPEMLRPMGLPEGVRVIAWGLSLERPTMIKYKIENIRDLFGHKADLPKQKNAPIARFF